MAEQYIIDKASFDKLIAEGSMQDIRNEVEKIVKTQNELLLDEKITEAASYDDSVEQLVNRFTNLKREAVFKECLESEDPMKAAVLMLTYETIRIKETKDSETNLVTREVVNIERDIDLIKLHKKAKKGIGHNTEWIYMLQKLNYLLAISVGQEIGDPKWAPENLKAVSDCFIMDDIAKAFSFGKTPTSNTQMLKTLTTIVQAMIGEEYKPTSHDVGFLKRCYSKKGKKAKEVQMPNHKTFCTMIRDICNECITHTGYEANSKAIKKK